MKRPRRLGAGGAVVCVVAWWWSVCGDLVDGGAGALLVDDVLAACHGGDEGLGGDVVDGPGQARAASWTSAMASSLTMVSATGELEVVGDVGGGLVGGHGGHGYVSPIRWSRAASTPSLSIRLRVGWPMSRQASGLAASISLLVRFYLRWAWVSRCASSMTRSGRRPRSPCSAAISDAAWAASSAEPWAFARRAR